MSNKGEFYFVASMMAICIIAILCLPIITIYDVSESDYYLLEPTTEDLKKVLDLDHYSGKIRGIELKPVEIEGSEVVEILVKSRTFDRDDISGILRDNGVDFFEEQEDLTYSLFLQKYNLPARRY